jgi:hypothetical protein
LKEIASNTLLYRNVPRGAQWRSALWIGIITAFLFATLASFHLTKQGLYYDELHQAAASFSYTENYEYKETSPYMFSRARLNGIPILNMSYSGALKTGIYGLYLRYFGSHFNVFEWRLLGIVLVSCGIFLFFVITSRRLSFASLTFFSFLLLTDMTVVIMTRHDWGPIALAMLIRLIFIATWINSEAKKAISIRNSFFLGCLVGIATFEKLSSIVLFLPLMLIFVLSPRRRTLRHLSACIAGCILGVTPLIILNLYSLFQYDYLVSFEALTRKFPYSLSALMTYVSDYISLGTGTIAKSFVLGLSASNYNIVEGILLSSVLLMSAIIQFRYYRTNFFYALSAVMLLCYIMLGIAIFMLPRLTWINHWIIGTPFQYAAILLALNSTFSGNIQLNFKHNLLHVLLIFFVSVLLISRLPGVISVTKAFERGQASIHWDPSLSKIGYFASRHSHEAIFIAADWGLATQIYCLSNGNPNLVHELFWKYRGLEELSKLVQDSGKKNFYVISLIPKTKVRPNNTARILRDIKKLRGWREVPIDDEMTKLKAVIIRKYSHIAKDVK